MTNDDVTFQHDNACNTPNGVDDIHTQMHRFVAKQPELESSLFQMERPTDKADETHDET